MAVGSLEVVTLEVLVEVVELLVVGCVHGSLEFIILVLGGNTGVLGGSLLGGLSLGEANDAAGDALSSALLHATLTAFNLDVLNNVLIVLSFVEDDGSSND